MESERERERKGGREFNNKISKNQIDKFYSTIIHLCNMHIYTYEIKFKTKLHLRFNFDNFKKKKKPKKKQ